MAISVRNKPTSIIHYIIIVYVWAVDYLNIYVCLTSHGKSLLTCVIIGIHYHSFECGEISKSMLITGTIVGYTIILIALTAGYLMQTPVNRRIDIFFSVVGCALFIASGAVLFDMHGHSDWKDKQTAKASLAIINGIIFLVDSILRFRGE